MITVTCSFHIYQTSFLANAETVDKIQNTKINLMWIHEIESKMGFQNENRSKVQNPNQS